MNSHFIMLKSLRSIILLGACLTIMALGAVSCGEYNKVLKSRDPNVRYEYSRKAYDNGKYEQAISLLTDLITPMRGTPEGEEALYLLALAHYNNKDYLNSGVYFKTYYQRYPKGKYTENARFYSGYGYYLDSPDPQLDQSTTVKAIEELSSYLDYYPQGDKVEIVRDAIFECQDKLTLKELQNAQLYYNLGNFLGNNYQSAIITAKNAVKQYPYSKYCEDFDLLILKSKFQEARESIEEKKTDRYREVVDEYYSFVNTYPESKHLKEAENIYSIASRYVRD